MLHHELYISWLNCLEKKTFQHFRIIKSDIFFTIGIMADILNIGMKKEVQGTELYSNNNRLVRTFMKEARNKQTEPFRKVTVKVTV